MTKQELQDFLRKSFTPIDNIPEDHCMGVMLSVWKQEPHC